MELLKRSVVNIMRRNPPVNLGQLWHGLVECRAMPAPPTPEVEEQQIRDLEGCRKQLVQEGIIGVVEDARGETLYLTLRTSLPRNRIVS